MADEAPVKDEKDSVRKSILKDVSEQISQAGTKVVTAVTNNLVNKEIERRTSAVLGAINTLKNLEKDLQKLKPDVITYASGSEVKSESYSKDVFEKRKQLNEKIAKVIKAIDLALEQGNYEQLFNLKIDSTDSV